MYGPALIIGAIIIGAVLLNRSGIAAKLGPDVPGDGGDPERRTAADVRDGWRPRVMELRKAPAWAMVGCGRRFFSATPIGGRNTNSPGGLWFAPGFVHNVGSTGDRGGYSDLPNLDFRACRPPPASGGGRGARRSWFQAVDAAWGNPTRSTVARFPFLAGGPGGWEGPEGTVQVMAVTIGGVAYSRSDQVEPALSVKGGTLWLANEGWIAVDSRGRDLPAPKILYKGEAIPAATWPGALEPWARVARGSRRSAMVMKGDRHDSGGHAAPFDIMGPVYIQDVLDRPRVLVSEVQS